MSMLTILSGLFAGLLARDSASSPPTPPPAPPAQPQFDARALYEALIGMNGGEPTDSTPFKLYTTRPLTGADAARLLEPAKPPPGVVPEGFALDAINNPMDLWGASGTITEGMFWLGFPYLAELAQRTEYRRISETIAKDMTRRWFRLQATGEDDKTDKIKALEELMKFHKLQEKFTLLALLDGFFGRGHLYIDTGQTDDTQLLKLPLPIDPRTIRKGSLKGIRVIEPMWAYPHMYNANDPLRENFYLPQSWWVMGKEIHRTRLLPFIGREMPDMLKPAYSFAGLSLSQMAKPYVDNWLRTRQSVSDLIHSFSTPVMMTNMGSVLNAGASAQLKMRAALFNYLRDNNNLMVLDKTTEDFKNVSAPLGALDHLQAQSQEHMASAVGIPLVVLLGISPSGLNATSEGELQVWAQFIHAAQGSFFDAHLTTILNVMQLHLFGEIDPSITHAWEPLRELSEEEEKTAEKTQADIDAVYVNAGVLSPDEIRQRLSGEADSPYQGLDLDTPAPPPPQQEQDPMGGGGGAPDPLGGGAGGGAGGPGGPPGAGGAAPHGMGTSAPAGGSAGPVSSGPGAIGSAGGSAAAPNPNKGSKDEEAVPELDETGMPVEKNRGHTRIATQDPDAEIHVHLGQNDRAHVKLGADSVGVVMGMDALDAYNPNEPRGQPQNAGQWTAGGGGGSYVQAGEAGEAGGRKAGRSTIHFHADPGQKLGQQSSGEGIGMKSLAGRALHSFGKEDYEILHKFTDSPPEQRQNIATRSVQFAKALPRMVLNAGIEEKNNVVHTAGALRSMLTGKGPSPEQWRGLRNIGLTALMVGVPMLLGDPLSAAEAVHHAGGELMNHVLIEHAAKMAIGVGLTTAALRRRKKTAAAPAHDADPAAGADPSPDDIAMVQKFLMQLSKSVMTLDGPTAQQMLEQEGGAQDEFDALDAFDPNEQRDASGRWGSGGGHIQYNLPPAPGTADIPEGHIRLYHQTDEKNLGAIKHQGIQMSKAQGVEGPKGIYADPKGFYGAPATTPTVEFHVPKAQYDGPFVRAQSVDPAQILAVHHPWHAIARSLEGNQGAIQAILSGKRDRLINDPTYGKAIRYIKHKFGGQASDEWNESDHPRGQPDNAGQFGAGGGGGAAEPATPKHGVVGLPEGKLTTEIRRLADRGGYEMKATPVARHKFESVDRYEVVVKAKAPDNIKTINEGRHTEQYDPELATVETLDPDIPEISRKVTRLKKGLPGRIPVEANPDHMYRGIDAEEFANIQKTGKIKSKSDYNMGGQEDLTYWSSKPGEAESYANSFAPAEHKPTFEKPCYFLVAKRVAPEHETKIKGTGETEIGVNRPVDKDELLEVWRGRVATMNAATYTITDHDGDYVAGSSSAPSAQVVWEKVTPGQAEDEWDESDHPRGQPGNAGQFGPGGGGGGARKAEGIASRAKGEATETRSGGSSAGRRQQRYAKARNAIDNLLQQPLDPTEQHSASETEWVQSRRLEEFNKIADITAKAFDFSQYRGSISFSSEKKTFALNGKEYEYAGAAYITGERKGDIVIYTDSSTLGSAAKVMAHEIGHQQTQYVLDVLQDEKQQINQLEKTEGMNAVRNAMDMLRPEYREKFPLYDRINHVFDTRLLSEEDGITDYSREWWQAFKDGKCDAMTAMHETLAEMSMLEYEGSLSRLLWYKESKAYRPLYEAVRDYAKQTT